MLYPVLIIKSLFHNNYSFHKIIFNDSYYMGISIFISDNLALRIGRVGGEGKEDHSQ